MALKADIYNIIRPRNQKKGMGDAVYVPRTDGIFGVEIEAEGNNLPNALDKTLWRVEADPSLKSGFEAHEYVMLKPTDLDGVKTSINSLKKSYDQYNTRIMETDTSGVHVHINVQNYTAKELFTFITTYLILEELLITYCGPQREGNHFCLRAKDAEYLLHEFVKTAQSHNFSNLNKDIVRYSSVNPCSLFLYGSLEFRAMRGTNDLNAIYEWVEILNKVRINAKQFSDPRNVIEFMSGQGEENFLKSILEEKSKIFTKVQNYAGMIKNGCRLVQPLAFIPDWESFKETKNNPFV